MGGRPNEDGCSVIAKCMAGVERLRPFLLWSSRICILGPANRAGIRRQTLPMGPPAVALFLGFRSNRSKPSCNSYSYSHPGSYRPLAAVAAVAAFSRHHGQLALYEKRPKILPGMTGQPRARPASQERLALVGQLGRLFPTSAIRILGMAEYYICSCLKEGYGPKGVRVVRTDRLLTPADGGHVYSRQLRRRLFLLDRHSLIKS